jgi:hypothetical protein
MALLDWTRPSFLVALPVLLIITFGCGSSSETMRVSGKVTYDGKPIETGSIVFVPISDGTAPGAGGSITDGAYDIPASSGPLKDVKYRVELSAMRKTGRKLRNIMTTDSPTMEETENYIPVTYNSKSTLQTTVTPENAGKQDFTLEAVKNTSVGAARTRR